ncbi:hypothetical protein JOQ06_006933, partial [Pogonophryne albipinna]
MQRWIHQILKLTTGNEEEYDHGIDPFEDKNTEDERGDAQATVPISKPPSNREGKECGQEGAASRKKAKPMPAPLTKSQELFGTDLRCQILPNNYHTFARKEPLESKRLEGLYILSPPKSRKTQAGERAGW